MRHLSFNDDGTELLTGSFDQTMALWDLQQGLTVDYLSYACHWANDYLTNQAEIDILALCQDEIPAPESLSLNPSP
ncbi:MAG: hypothetical protein HC922_02955 [Leptolyngbyaceae cyanobacterium SM2_3_12]|nr:hypothetical protein [Leptolyngbyaceae cyanobacterium SM2_3_12]